MVKFIRGKFGRDAVKEIKRGMHLNRVRYGKLPNINAKEEKQIIERTVKVFSKDGRAPYKIKERDFEKEILNPLRIKHDDQLDSREIDEIDRGFGLTEHTKKIGVKYYSIIKQEKKLAEKKRFEELKAKKTDENKNIPNKKIYGKIEQADNRFGGMKKSDNIEGENRFGGMPAKQGILKKETTTSKPDSKIAPKMSKTGASSQGTPRAMFAPSISYNFSGGVPRPGIPPEEPVEITHDTLTPKVPQESPGRETPPGIPGWKLAAYGTEAAETPSDKPAENDNDLGGLSNDSFGEEDQKNN